MASPRLLRGRTSEVHAVYCVTTVVAGRRRMLCAPGIAGIVGDEFRRIEAEGFAASIAWVVMPDHLHWMLSLKSDALGSVVQRLKARSSRRIGERLGVAPPIWQAGYYDHRMRADEDLRTQARYLLMNPVRAGLVQRIEDWPASWCRWPVTHADL